MNIINSSQRKEFGVIGLEVPVHLPVSRSTVECRTCHPHSAEKDQHECCAIREIAQVQPTIADAVF